MSLFECKNCEKLERLLAVRNDLTSRRDMEYSAPWSAINSLTERLTWEQRHNGNLYKQIDELKEELFIWRERCLKLQSEKMK